ncbi:6031_t:CDS:2 [Dentiscutata erythropus]|uniref:6031_t:CDS:1 n=1 Tax=Dentiscutata erythropus TaxID=1348616 RepID=A0A9N9D3F0_9GLOM|nr:6031_t:CDS:2 [Dentiscutata erythropus]
MKKDICEYVQNCNTCNQTISIKEKNDLTPVVSHSLMKHLQMDLIDFTAYKDMNDRFSWLLTMTKEANIVGKDLISLFAQWGVLSILQPDNSKEFTANVVKCICEELGT